MKGLPLFIFTLAAIGALGTLASAIDSTFANPATDAIFCSYCETRPAAVAVGTYGSSRFISSGEQASYRKCDRAVRGALARLRGSPPAIITSAPPLLPSRIRNSAIPLAARPISGDKT